jgi:hypothetical protein
LKKLPSLFSEQTSDSSTILNAMCLLKHVLNCEQHFKCFIFRSGLTVTGLERVCYMWKEVDVTWFEIRLMNLLTYYDSLTNMHSCRLETQSIISLQTPSHQTMSIRSLCTEVRFDHEGYCQDTVKTTAPVFSEALIPKPHCVTSI